MRNPSLLAVDEALDRALAHPKSALALGVLGLVGALVGALASPVAGAVVAAALFVALVAVFVYALHQRARFDGPYEVLETDAVWDLADPDASEVTHTKRQRVRFNYPTIAIEDQAWGDGDVFYRYEAEYGEVLTRRRDGSRDYVIVALPAQRQRGEEAILVSHRTIKNGFGDPREEWIELENSQTSGESSFTVRFPAARPPRNLRLRRSSDGRERTIPEREIRSEGNRKVYSLREHRVRRGEQYRLKWNW